MAGRLPESNSNAVTVTDRAAIGPQPDNTPATGGSPTGGGGGGTPTGPAGGDLTGTYPNPALAAIGGGAIGPIGDGTHVPVVTRDAKGRVTALTSTPITGAPPTGAAGGDLTGTFPNPTLAAIGAATGPVGDATHVPVVTIDAKGRVTGLTSTPITSGSGITTLTGTEFSITNPTGPTANIASNNTTPNTTAIGPGAVINGGMKMTVQGTQGDPATSGTTQTKGNYRVQTGNTVMDVGTRTSGKTWLQSYDASDLSLHYGIELNPLGGDTELGGATGESFGQTKGVRTGDILRTWKARIGDIFNVLDFRLLSDPDETAAIQRAVTAAGVTGRGCIYFPAGVYVVSSAITNGADAQFFFLGQGQGVSVISFTSASAAAAIDLTFSAPAYYATFVDLEFRAGAVVKRLLRCTGNGVSSSEYPGMHFERVRFGSPGGGSYYQTGLELVGCWAVRVVNSFFCGKPNGDPNGTDAIGTGLLVNSTSALSVNGLVVGCRFSFLNKCAYIGGVDGSGFANNSDGAANCEGWTFRDCIMLAMQWGIVEMRSGTQTPWLTAENCEFEPRRTGNAFLLHNVSYFYASGCLILSPDVAGQTVFSLDTVSFSVIRDNIMGGAPDRVFDFLNGCGAIKVHDNQSATAGTEIARFSAGSNNIWVRSNVVVTMPGTYYTDSGSNNIVEGPYVGYAALVVRTSTQSIAAATATAISWQSATTNQLSIWAGGSPTRLTVPTSVRKVRLTANVRWENSAGVAYRYVYIQKNGSGSAIMASSAKPNIVTSQDNISTGKIDVVAGDYFEVFVAQNEATSLNIEPSAGGEVFFSMEIVA